MKRSMSTITILLCGVGFSAVLVAAGRQDSRPAVAVQPPGNIYRAQLDRYCVTCHNQRSRRRGCHSTRWTSSERSRSRRDVGEGHPQAAFAPDAPGRCSAAGRCDSLRRVRIVAGKAKSIVPRRPTPTRARRQPFHRLNRAEYQNVIRDLLDLEIDVKDLLPPDDASYGFDNIGGVLKINQPVMERYLSAARRISRIALGSTDTPATSLTVRLRPDLPQFERLEGLPFGYARRNRHSAYVPGGRRL